MRRLARILLVAAMLLVTAIPTASAQEDPVVRALFFFSPSCGHCHIVINEHLPGMFEANGGTPQVFFDESVPIEEVSFYLVTNGTLEIMLVDVSIAEGADLYRSSAEELELPNWMMGVPRLIIGEEAFVGSGDIPAYLPDLIDSGLASGGTDWPALEGMGVALEAIPPTDPNPGVVDTTVPAGTDTTSPGGTDTTVPDSTTITTVADSFPDVGPTDGNSEGVYGEEANTVGEKFRRDLAGNIVAVIALAGMLASLAAVGMLLGRRRITPGPVWLIPVLAAIGVIVALYLSYVETSGNEAVCGPVGNCDAVQDSKSALLFGFIPIGIIGLAGYAVVIGGWAVAGLKRVPWSDWASVALAAGAGVGVVFSIYLTFLEPFVIGATCLWCLASAVVITALFWLSAEPGWQAWKRLRAG